MRLYIERDDAGNHEGIVLTDDQTQTLLDALQMTGEEFEYRAREWKDDEDDDPGITERRQHSAVDAHALHRLIRGV